MRTPTLTILFSVALALHANAQQLSKPVIDSVNHHIVRVRNSGPTKWIGTSGWKLVLERSFGADDSKGLIAEPNSIDADRTGRIIETDWKVDGIQVFAADGRFERVIGRTGDGPGEFKAPVSIVTSGDTIIAFAGNQRRVTIATTAGNVIGQWKANYCCGIGPSLDGKGNVMLNLSVQVSGASRRASVRIRRDGVVIDTLVYSPEAPVKSWDIERGSYSIPFTAYTVSTTDHLGRRISGDATRYALNVALHGADTARTIEMPGMRVPVSVIAADSVFAIFAKREQLSIVVKRSDIPALQPYFKSLHVDEFNNIWIARPAPNGSVAEFDVITSDGIFLGTVAAPHNGFYLQVFRNGRMYCVVKDTNGEPMIQVYRIEKNGK